MALPAPWGMPSTGTWWGDLGRGFARGLGTTVPPEVQMAALDRKMEEVNIARGKNALETSQFWLAALKDRQAKAQALEDKYQAERDAEQAREAKLEAWRRDYARYGPGVMMPPPGYVDYAAPGEGAAEGTAEPETPPRATWTAPPAGAEPEGPPPSSQIEPRVSPYREKLSRSPQYLFGEAGAGAMIGGPRPDIADPARLSAFAQPYPGGGEQLARTGPPTMGERFGVQRPAASTVNPLTEAVAAEESTQTVDPERLRQQQQMQAQEQAARQAQYAAQQEAAPAARSVPPSAAPAPVPTGGPGGGGGIGAVDGSPGAMQQFGGMGLGGGMGMGGGGQRPPDMLPEHVYDGMLRQAQFMEDLGHINSVNFPNEAAYDFNSAYQMRESAYNAQVREASLVRQRNEHLANLADTVSGLGRMEERVPAWVQGVRNWSEMYGLPLNPALMRMRPTDANLAAIIGPALTMADRMKGIETRSKVALDQASADRQEAIARTLPERVRAETTRAEAYAKGGALGAKVSASEYGHVLSVVDALKAVRKVQDIIGKYGAVTGIPGAFRSGMETLEAPFGIEGSYAKTQYDDAVNDLKLKFEPLRRITGRGGNPWSRALIDAETALNKPHIGVGIVRRRLRDLEAGLARDLETTPAFETYLEQISPDAQRERRLEGLEQQAGARELTTESEAQ